MLNWVSTYGLLLSLETGSRKKGGKVKNKAFDVHNNGKTFWY